MLLNNLFTLYYITDITNFCQSLIQYWYKFLIVIVPVTVVVKDGLRFAFREFREQYFG